MTRRFRSVLLLGALVASLAVWFVSVRSMTGRSTPPEAPPSTTADGRGGDRAVGERERERDAGVGSRSEAGARAAAIAYATAPQRWLYLEDAEVEAAVRAISTEASAERLAAEVSAEIAAAREGLAGSSGRVWWLVRPLATRVEHSEDGRARVSVWTVTVLSATGVAVPQADWLTVTVDLEWDRGVWRVAAVDDEVGPTPMVGVRDRPWQPERFDEALDGFERVGEETP